MRAPSMPTPFISRRRSARNTSRPVPTTALPPPTRPAAFPPKHATIGSRPSPSTAISALPRCNASVANSPQTAACRPITKCIPTSGRKQQTLADRRNNRTSTLDTAVAQGPRRAAELEDLFHGHREDAIARPVADLTGLLTRPVPSCSATYSRTHFWLYPAQELPGSSCQIWIFVPGCLPYFVSLVHTTS